MTHIFSQVPLPLAYGIGALLYTPANRVSVADSICHQRFGTKFSLALCLEDTINDAYLPQAEQQAIQPCKPFTKNDNKKNSTCLGCLSAYAVQNK